MMGSDTSPEAESFLLLCSTMPFVEDFRLVEVEGKLQMVKT